MQSTRIISLVVFLLSFGLFAYAAPTQELAKRCTSGCDGTNNALLSILTDLQVKVYAQIDLLVKGRSITACLSVMFCLRFTLLAAALLGVTQAQNKTKIETTV